ncbi:MAG: hypothetical protein A4E66_01049 [Syntrophus sp. PtaB.Bin001]|nr:MAG: hypothetical protein A4E66_01049 [Syntrophus sp. PtaB.Bin001]
MEHGQHLSGIPAVEGGIVEGGLDAVIPEGVDLVFHQGNQGRNHDAHPGTVQGRNLVAERFAAARGHQDKGILAANESLDYLLLVEPESIVSEDFFQTFEWGLVHEMTLCLLVGTKWFYRR